MIIITKRLQLLSANRLIVITILLYVFGNIFSAVAVELKDEKNVPNSINKITNIDFHRIDNGGELVVDLDNSTVAVNVESSGNNLILTFYNTQIPEELLYILNVTDFATPVKEVETFKALSNVKIVLNIDDKYEYQYLQDGSRFWIRVTQHISSKRQVKTQYSGKKVSLNFQNIAMRTVLQIIAEHNNFNLVVTDSVSGDITLRLNEVPWDQALDLILKTKGLDKRIEGNILMIAPAAEIAIREKQQLKNQQNIQDIAPLFSEYIQVNYAKATDIAMLLKGQGAGLLSSRGTVAVDERTNTLLVKDTATILKSIKKLLEVLDIPVKQVLIEARMITVKDDVAEDLGIRWGITNQNGDFGTSGSLEGIGDAGTLDDRFNVNLPAAVSNASSIAFRVAKLADGTILDLELSALEQENKGEIIASPRITTSNQKAAYIEQGVEIPYVESASSGATTVQFKKAVLSLRVTPQITPDNRVVLDLEISQDSQGKTVDTPLGEAVSIDTQRIGTQILADNGETIVLGGIYQQNLISRTRKVPFLGDIPYLGSLFKSSSDSNERQELLIFVTPRIVTEKI